MTRSDAIKRGLRPCIIKLDERSKVKAYFHKWADYSKPAVVSVSKDGTHTAVINSTYAIVENAYTGAVFKCSPENITFKDYDYEEFTLEKLQELLEEKRKESLL